MSTDRVNTLTRWLAILLAAAYAIAGVVGLFADIDPTRDKVVFVVALLGGAILIVAGLVAVPSSTWVAAVLISIGAVAGAVVLFWSVLAPIAAIALVVLSFLRARRQEAPAAGAA